MDIKTANALRELFETDFSNSFPLVSRIFCNARSGESGNNDRAFLEISINADGKTAYWKKFEDDGEFKTFLDNLYKIKMVGLHSGANLSLGFTSGDLEKDETGRHIFESVKLYDDGKLVSVDDMDKLMTRARDNLFEELNNGCYQELVSKLTSFTNISCQAACYESSYRECRQIVNDAKGLVAMNENGFSDTPKVNYYEPSVRLEKAYISASGVMQLLKDLHDAFVACDWSKFNEVKSNILDYVNRIEILAASDRIGSYFAERLTRDVSFDKFDAYDVLRLKNFILSLDDYFQNRINNASEQFEFYSEKGKCVYTELAPLLNQTTGFLKSPAAFRSIAKVSVPMAPKFDKASFDVRPEKLLNTGIAHVDCSAYYYVSDYRAKN